MVKNKEQLMMPLKYHIILNFDGKKIDTMRTLPKVVASTEVGKSVELKIWRN